MSDDTDNGNGNRATVAMVLREVENLAKVTGAHFETVNVKLEGVTQIAARQDKMDGELRALSLMVVTLRDSFSRHVKETDERIANEVEAHRFRRIHWPTMIIAVLGVLVAIAAIYFASKA